MKLSTSNRVCFGHQYDITDFLLKPIGRDDELLSVPSGRRHHQNDVHRQEVVLVLARREQQPLARFRVRLMATTVEQMTGNKCRQVLVSLQCNN